MNGYQSIVILSLAKIIIIITKEFMIDDRQIYASFSHSSKYASYSLLATMTLRIIA
jgi:hypothetical protein